MPKGYLSIVLHAHLPYVRHPEHAFSLEERWFYEALSECYIPLIWTIEKLLQDDIDFKLTVSLSPPLLCMLDDTFLQERYIRHLEGMLELCEKEVRRTRGTPFEPVAEMYQYRYRGVYDTFCRRYQRNLLTAFKAFQDSGSVEVITSAATHGYLPLMMEHPEAARAQVAVGVRTYQRYFGQKPRGIWLPECAYAPGIDDILKEQGIQYFFTDSHGILFSDRRPRYGIFAPIYCPTGVAAFGRDIESSKQVWSAKEGYPGDFDYREYYRDIGFDLNFDYVRPHIHPEGIRIHTGLKYHRITGAKTHHKEPYVPEWAESKIDIHAANFVFNREHQVEYLARHMDRPPMIVAPYDAELFGHWWFEGPRWLELLMRKVAQSDQLEMMTPGVYLDRHRCNQVATPCTSSWGDQGYHDVWLGNSNHWIYRHLHWSAGEMVKLARDYPQADGMLNRALTQAARELLLAQSSDWAFIMATDTMVDYANKRTKRHLANFKGIWHQIRENRIEPEWISSLEQRDNIFPELDYQVYA